MLSSWSEFKQDPTSQIIPDPTRKLGKFSDKKDHLVQSKCGTEEEKSGFRIRILGSVP
jgi:hypothetical protein